MTVKTNSDPARPLLGTHPKATSHSEEDTARAITVVFGYQGLGGHLEVLPGEVNEQGCCTGGLHTGGAAVMSHSCPGDDCGEENAVGVRCKGENIRKEGNQHVQRFLHSVRARAL